MASPWLEIQTSEPKNLKEIMKDEANKSTRTKKSENRKAQQSDSWIAKLPQHQYDKKHIDVSEEIDSEEDGLQNLCDCKEWRRFDDFVKQRPAENQIPSKIPLSLPQSSRNPIHNLKHHLLAETELNDYSRFVINSFIKMNLFNGVSGVVSIGKESVVLHADSNASYEKIKLPAELAIKVFNFNHPDCKYNDKCRKMKGDKIIHASARQEMLNLGIYKNAGIACPDAIMYKPRVLIMSFIGDSHTPAIKLQNIKNEEDFIAAYVQVIDAMKCLYEKAKLIHTDLSDNNILWHNGTCYFIDINELIDVTHASAFTYLMESCTRISKFFKRHITEASKVASEVEIFFDIVGCLYGDRISLEKIRKGSNWIT